MEILSQELVYVVTSDPVRRYEATGKDGLILWVRFAGQGEAELPSQLFHQ